MRFHVVALPHSQTTRAFSACAFNEKVRKFCMMMKSRGHTVYLYAGEQNEAPCDEHVVCITEAERLTSLGGRHFTTASFDYSLPHWVKFNSTVIEAMKSRLQEKDFICLIGGLAHKQIADAYPGVTSVEFGIGYPGSFAKFRVWESYAWMHTCYGADQGKNSDGHWMDEVIPSYYDPAEFQFEATKDPYLLFVGRMIDRKGIHVAKDIAQASGLPLITAGPGDPIPGIDHRGVIGPEERSRLMGKATALLAPSIYIEPFGSVSMEAQACGTPVIATDWGAFTETVEHGKTGFRCRTLQDYVYAVRACHLLDPLYIARRAERLWSLDAVALVYERYFERLMTLWGDGWYTLEPSKDWEGLSRGT